LDSVHVNIVTGYDFFSSMPDSLEEAVEREMRM
jgi:hypothetical protein